ncbi:DUF6429 family protein [Methylocaldum sp.]|uniref:DUF6429 family protein n=1 Tax=Methylocaldum sp. TaxID=1969727 RepID=UPI0039C8DE80
MRYLSLHDNVRAWKSLDCDVMNRLHEKGYILNPVGKAKSVTFTEKGLRKGERLFASSSQSSNSNSDLSDSYASIFNNLRNNLFIRQSAIQSLDY